MVERQHDLGHRGAGHGLHHLRAGADDALALGLRSHHEAGNVLQVDQRMAEALAGLHEVRHFARRFRIDDAADPGAALRLQETAPIRDDRHRMSRKAGARAEHFRGVIGLKLGVIGAVENAEDHFFDVVGEAVVGREYAVEVGGVPQGRNTGREARATGQLAEALADARQAIGVVLGHVVRHATDGGVHLGSTQGLRLDHLSGGSLHQVRPSEAHETGSLHHNDDVAERREVGSARDAGAHHGGDLRDAQLPPHDGVVIEDAPRSILAGEDPVLVGEVYAGGIHQVHNGQAIPHGDFLRAENLGDRLGPPGAGLHGGIIGHDDRGAVFDLPQAGDDARGRRLAVVAVVGDQQANLEEKRPGIHEAGDALPGRHLAGPVLPLDARGPAAFAQTRLQFLKLPDEEAHVRLARDIHDHFNFEKSAGSMKTDSGGLARILPSFSESAATFFHSGSALNSLQFLAAASRLGWARM